MPKGTTLRNIRVSDELWQSAQECADAQGMNVSEVIRLLLKSWVDGEIPIT